MILLIWFSSKFASVCEARLLLCVEHECPKAEIVLCMPRMGLFFAESHLPKNLRWHSMLAKRLVLLKIKGGTSSWKNFGKKSNSAKKPNGNPFVSPLLLQA